MAFNSWILKCLKIVGAAENITKLINNSITKWKMVLTSGKIEIGHVIIKKENLQGD